MWKMYFEFEVVIFNMSYIGLQDKSKNDPM